MSSKSNSTDASSTIAAGGTAQNLFASTPDAALEGLLIHNLDATNDLWFSEHGTAAANAVGSIRIPANGGEWWTKEGHRPTNTGTIVGAVTGQKYTCKYWSR